MGFPGSNWSGPPPTPQPQKRWTRSNLLSFCPVPFHVRSVQELAHEAEGAGLARGLAHSLGSGSLSVGHWELVIV